MSNHHINVTTDEGSPSTSSADHQLPEDTPSLPPTGCHIVRSQAGLVDRYHGPCTLFTLCTEFRDTLLAEQPTQSWPLAEDGPQQGTLQDKIVNNDALGELLALMCLEAGSEESFDLPTNHYPIRLPPKKFLLMVQSQFFQQANIAIDIFVQSSFWSNVERIYSRTFAPADEAWAICFNSIILLVLGSEVSTQGSDPLVGSQFALPFLSTVRAALSNPRILMAPRLINVQALALLSIAAQQYYPPGFAESIFAQACVLARTMGLHQSHAASDGVGPEEAQERFKVFTSLYVRDKSFSISRGSICWLPSFDCIFSPELGQIASADSNWTARFQLARLQEEIYRLFHSAESQKQSSAKQMIGLSRIEQSLERWADAHGIFSSSHTGTNDVDLQLEFLAARISTLRGNTETGHVRRALDAARASCILLLIFYGKHEPFMVERLETLVLSQSPSKNLGKSASPGSEARKATSGPVPLLSHSLLDTFSVPAFFLLVKALIWPVSTIDESKAEEDMDLLQKVWACCKELDAKTQANNHTRKVGRAFERLLRLVNLVKNSQQLPTSLSGTAQSSNSHTPQTMHHYFSGPQSFSDFMAVPTPSAFPLPDAVSWDCLSSNKTSTRTSDAASTGAPTGMITPMDSEYMCQPFDALQQQYFSPQFPQQTVSMQSRKRPCWSEPDVPMDDFPDPRLFSDFLTAGPMQDSRSQDSRQSPTQLRLL